MKKHIFCIACIVFIVRTVYAQKPRFSFQKLGKEAGLDVRYNSFVFEDSQGFIWISSLQGIYRFDGQNLEHFLIENENERIDSDQLIQSNFWEDQQGNLWFSTYSALHVYRRKTGRFQSIQLTQDENIIDQGYHVFFFEKRSGLLWLKAGVFIWKYNIQNGEYRNLPHLTKGARFAVDTSIDGRVKKILACPFRNGPGVEYFYLEEGGQWQKRNYQEAAFKELEVAFALFEKEKITWLFSNRGLWQFNPNNANINGPYKPVPSSAFASWAGAFINQKQNILLSSVKEGLWLFDISKKKFIQSWQANEQDPTSLASNSPMEIYLDRQDQVWISHYGVGLDYASSGSNLFTTPLRDGSSKALPIISLIEDQKRQIWALSPKQGVFVFSSFGTLKQIIPFPENNMEVFLQISMDTSGQIWAISSHDVFQWDMLKNQWKTIASFEKMLISIYHLPLNRKLIITNEGAFDLIFNNDHLQLLRSKEFKAYQAYPFYRFIKSNTGRTFVPFHYNDLWITETRQGVLQVTDSFHLGGDTYCAFQFPASDSTWLGTERGLQLYQNKQITPALKENWQKEGYSAYGVLGDRQNRLWFSTNQGLRLYDLQTGRLSKFTEADGLPSDVFSPYAHLLASDGKMWFGTDAGLVVFHPDSIQLNTPTPNPYIEAMWINNVPYQPEFAIGEADSLQLNYRQNTLDFELIAIGYYQPENSKLKYRLAGYDDSWAAVPNGGFARFTKVPPGEYTLEIIGVNANEVEGAQKNLRIYIKPPFWQRLWFQLLAILTVILFIASIVGAYYRRKLRAQQILLEKQKALQDERDRIAKELHDDLGGDLSNILYISDDLVFDLPEGEQKTQLERIAALAQGSIDSMREFIWVKDASKNTLDDLIGKLLEFAPPYLADNKIACRFNLPEEKIPAIELGSEKRRNIFLILKESLHNVVKHAQAREVNISVLMKEKKLFIKIRDDGRGFNPEQAAGSGNGLGNMQDRAAALPGKLDIQSTPGKGALLQLEIQFERL